MEYPGTWFTKGYRHALLAVFILAFIIITPLIIISTSGYRYNLKTGRLAGTGSIGIDILPKSVAVSLSGRPLPGTMPVRVQNIPPDNYQLVLTAPGYFDWSKEITVASRQTTYISGFRLIKQSVPEQLVSGTISNLSLSYDGHYLAYLKKSQDRTEAWLIDTESLRSFLITSFPKDLNITLLWSQKHNWLALGKKIADNNYTVSVIEADRPEYVKNLITPNGEPITKFTWRQLNEPELYYSTAKTLRSFLPRTNQHLTITAIKFADWFMENGELWTISWNKEKQGIEVTKDALGFSAVWEPISLSSDNGGPSASMELLSAHDDTAIIRFASKPSELVISKANTHFSVTGNDWRYAPELYEWLFWTPWELSNYQNEEKYPRLFTRSSARINDVAPLDKGALAIVTADTILALFPYYHIQHAIINRSLIRSVATDAESRLLYFADNAGLWKLEY